MWPSVSSKAMPSFSQMTFSKPMYSLKYHSTSSLVRCGLRLWFSTLFSVTISVPSPSICMAPPSNTIFVASYAS